MVGDIDDSLLKYDVKLCVALGVKAGPQMAGIKRMLDRITQS